MNEHDEEIEKVRESVWYGLSIWILRCLMFGAAVTALLVAGMLFGLLSLEFGKLAVTTVMLFIALMMIALAVPTVGLLPITARYTGASEGKPRLDRYLNLLSCIVRDLFSIRGSRSL